MEFPTYVSYRYSIHCFRVKKVAPLFAFLVPLLLLLLVGCKPQQESQFELIGQTMGTTYSIKYVPMTSQVSPEQLQKEIDDALAQVNAQMSTYDPNSELSLFNQNQDSIPVSVSHDLLTVIEKAIELNKTTEGALDITVGPLVNLWGFGPSGRVIKKPTPEAIEVAKERMGLDKLTIDKSTHAIAKTKSDLYIDLSSIAKGFGVDKVALLLEKNGIQNYLVDIGGETRTKGVNGAETPWRIAIEKPISGGQSAQQVVIPRDKSIATSGDYRNYFEEDGVRYSHIIDPKTAQPIQNRTVSVSVIADDCMTADGFATALSVLGAEEGYRVAQRIGLAVYFIIKTDNGFTYKYTDAFKQYLPGA